MPSRDLDPVTRLTADAVGVPGKRTFYLQAASGADQVTLLVEKQQVLGLAQRLASWLPLLDAARPEDPKEAAAAEAGDLRLAEPLEPDFRIGQLTLSYDDTRDRILLVATELVDAEQGVEPQEVRLWVTRAQLRVLARHGAEVAARGRPLCPLCELPMDPDGHVCPAHNGHRPSPG